MKTILLVEDDKDNTYAMGIRLKHMGYRIECADNAISAASLAGHVNPQVALIDVYLPGGDGFAVAENLRLAASTAAISIIFMTASKLPGLRERAIEMGALAFLEKPFDSSQLEEAIHLCSI